MFIDQAEIRVISGAGGDGSVHFRREKYIPFGGPDGGDGGRGGDVVLEVNPTLTTLLDFSRKREHKAESGKPGARSNMTGKSAPDLVIPVPPGTIVRDAQTGATYGDLVTPGQRLVVARGGRGGRGNARFATSTNQAPHVAERGEPREERSLKLELKLIADVGIVGVPNAGKSTLLASVSNARPKIADYPFTTLEPNLGVVSLDNDTTFVLADIPGLIEGAHEGRGLGFSFLRHVQRTRVLIHLLDGLSPDPMADLSQINSEMALFDPNLTQKAMVVAVNKADMPEVQARWPELLRDLSRRGHDPILISALARTNVRDLLFRAARLLAEAPSPPAEEALPVYRPETDPNEFAITREPNGAYRVAGQAIEKAAEMTYWEHDEAVERFQRILERLGIRQALADAGIEEGDSVLIGEYELEWSD